MRVCLSTYPGALLSGAHGLVDFFFMANRIAFENSFSTIEPLSISCHYIGPDTKSIEALAFTNLEDCSNTEQFDIVIILPNLQFQCTDQPDPVLLKWIIDQHQNGAIICSVCTAAFLLGKTGLLDGRPATTHWRFKDAFSEQFPNILIHTDQMIIDDGDIITAGGVTAWIDLALHLIDKCLGASIMVEVAQFFLVDVNGRDQRLYSKFFPRFNHGDRDILKVQHWLQSHYREPILVANMAALVNLGERTFLRRFKKSTGMKPIEYLQMLRIGKAREILEYSQIPLHEVAREVGYEDPGAFRKIFQRLMGLQPSEYRRRFSVSR